jgi:hypothetical protein
MRRLIGWTLLCCAIAVLGSSSPVRDDPDFGTRAITLKLARISTAGISVSARLRAVGAWHVTSSDAGFGGVSAMAVMGGRIVALTDAGSLIDVRPQFVAGVATGTIVGIAAGCGYDGQKTSRDSESLAIDPATGVRWIGFEWRKAMCRIDPWNADATRFVAPPMMTEWPRTGGPEAMTRLRDGRFIIVAERPRDEGRDSPLIVVDRDPLDPAAEGKLTQIRPPSGFRPTEIAELPDGSLVVLVRSFRPPLSFGGQIVNFQGDALGQRVVKGKRIAEFRSPLDENFEALAVTRSGDKTYVWAMSDDNFMPFQRTILVLLEYTG